MKYKYLLAWLLSTALVTVISCTTFKGANVTYDPGIPPEWNDSISIEFPLTRGSKEVIDPSLFPDNVITTEQYGDIHVPTISIEEEGHWPYLFDH